MLRLIFLALFLVQTNSLSFTELWTSHFRFKLKPTGHSLFRDPLALAKHINSLNTTWKADESFKSHPDKSYWSRKLGFLPDPISYSQLPIYEHRIRDGDIPDTFDSRSNWPQCQTIGLIGDQSDCGSCWAFATTEVFSDRICIHSPNQTLSNVQMSAEDLISCGWALLPPLMGCNGGSMASAFRYIHSDGLVTGGQFGSNRGCRPYSLPGCSHHGHNGTLPPCDEKPDSTPKCSHQCVPGYNLTYNQDKHYTNRPYSIHGEKQMQMEILKNGPITASFLVMEDFLLYKSGIYHWTTGGPQGGHAVKILGWGVENGEKYWLVANSWNAEWGEKGYFRIRRGTDECGIEGFLIYNPVAAIPKF